MDGGAQPSTSSGRRGEECLSPRKKRKPQSFSPTEKDMILNVYKYVHAEKQSESPTETPKKNECVLKTAEILVKSRASVYKVLKEHKENENFNSPNKPGPKLNFKQKIDDFTLSAIRQKVHKLFLTNETPTLNKILQSVNEDPDLPTLSRSMLHKILKHLNFKLQTQNKAVSQRRAIYILPR